MLLRIRIESLRNAYLKFYMMKDLKICFFTDLGRSIGGETTGDE
jgi:hypothetical protein